MKKNQLLWDILVIWPLVWVLLFIVFAGGLGVFISSQIEMGTEPGAGLFLSIAFVFVLHAATIILGWIAWFRTIHVMYTETKLEKKKKLFWLVMMAFFTIIAMPILHFTHLRK